MDGMTAAHAAALEGHLECLVFLLGSAGCSALARDRAANTPLHYGKKTGKSIRVKEGSPWIFFRASHLGVFSIASCYKISA